MFGLSPQTKLPTLNHVNRLLYVSKSFLHRLMYGLLLGLAAPACLATPGAEITLTSDYVFRGISQSDGRPALQGSFYYQGDDSGLYGGLFTSIMDRDSIEGEAVAEIDVYAGVQGTVPLDLLPLFSRDWVDDWLSWDLSARYYAFPGADENPGFDKPDFWEVSAGLSGHFPYFSLWSQIAWSPDFLGNYGTGTYLAGGAVVPLPWDLTAGGHVGFQDIAENNRGEHDTLDWSVSVTKALQDIPVRNVSITAAYTDTDPRGADCFFGSDLCDARALISITKRW